MALPLYAWCIVVGCTKTKSMPKYALRLLGLAVISQPLYMMALNHTWTDRNILFLLALAVLVIWGIQQNFLLSRIWAPILAYVLLGIFKIDYGWKGLTFILLLYMARRNRSSIAATYMAYALFWGTTSSVVSTIGGMQLSFLTWGGIGTVLQPLFKLQSMIWLALPLILIETRVPVKIPKWLGYGLYPLHLIVLVAVRMLMGTGLDVIFKGF